MCRLLAFSSPEPTSFADLLGEATRSFIDLSHKHADGWGAAWVTPDGTIGLRKSARPAFDDPEALSTLSDVRSTALIFHLRWASPGIPVTPENAHPFLLGQTAFAHNGSLDVTEALRANIPEDLKQGLEGTTDSEVYFRLALAIRRGTGDGGPALSRAVQTIQDTCRHTGLNALLLTPDRLEAVCSFNPMSPILNDDRHYYDLHVSQVGRATLVGSAGWDPADGWDELGNGRILSVCHASSGRQVTDVA